MIVISNDPNLWPVVNFYLVSSYFTVAASVVVVYEWGLVFGQEFELVWRQRWSLMTILYLGLRTVGILYIVVSLLRTYPHILIVFLTGSMQ
jgi:hypothetical protein